MNTVASRCSAKITRPRRICDQKLPDGGPPSAGLTTPGLRSAVSLTVPSRPVPRSSYPQAAGTSAGCGPATRCLHVLPAMILLDHYRAAAWPAQAIGPDREISVCGVRSNPPEATLPCRLYFLMIAPTVWVEPASTAKMPLRLDLCARM